jgi:hypothetical protein
VRCLIDGDAIAQLGIDDVTYWHVELAAHDVLLAEGLPAESFLDTGNRDAFVGGKAMALHPDFAGQRREAACCAPLLMHGPAVAAVRAGVRTFAQRSRLIAR